MHRKSCVTAVLFSLGIASLVGIPGCGSSDAVRQPTGDDRFQHAKALFDDADYLEAINEFTVITLQNQGSSFAADAQFYLAESRFQRGEYLLAAFEYQVLRRNYTASPRGGAAQYKIGLCYHHLSPKSFLDQQYTRKAIDELQAFVEYYPTDSLVADASSKIRELNTRLAKKQFETATLYTSMDYYKSALLSFDEIIERYHDTDYAPLSYQAKAELLMTRRHYREAQEEINRFLTKYPNSVLRRTMDDLRTKTEVEIKNGNNVDSGTPRKKPMLQDNPQL